MTTMTMMMMMIKIRDAISGDKNLPSGTTKPSAATEQVNYYLEAS